MSLEVRYGQRGRGVFTTKDLEVGDVVEVCPSITLNSVDVQGRLNRYLFHHPDNRELAVLPVGYALLYNHDDKNNVHADVRETEVVFTVTKPVKSGEELLIHYGADYEWNIECAVCGQHDHDADEEEQT